MRVWKSVEFTAVYINMSLLKKYDILYCNQWLSNTEDIVLGVSSNNLRLLFEWTSWGIKHHYKFVCSSLKVQLYSYIGEAVLCAVPPCLLHFNARKKCGMISTFQTPIPALQVQYSTVSLLVRLFLSYIHVLHDESCTFRHALFPREWLNVYRIPNSFNRDSVLWSTILFTSSPIGIIIIARNQYRAYIPCRWNTCIILLYI